MILEWQWYDLLPGYCNNIIYWSDYCLHSNHQLFLGQFNIQLMVLSTGLLQESLLSLSVGVFV